MNRENSFAFPSLKEALLCYNKSTYVTDGRAMSMDIKLSSKIILEKEFKKSMKGYHIDQVDQFLDQIMEDYDTFEKKVNELQAEIDRLKTELENSTRKTATPQPNLNTNTNFDILKRLSNLEKHVFGSKLYE